MSSPAITVLTGNDLLTGDVIWWTGDGWSRQVDDAAALRDDAGAIIAAQQAAPHVVGVYAVEARRDGTGCHPAQIKERIRARGPTVRPPAPQSPSLHPAKD